MGVIATIIIGILGALLGVYFKEELQKANNKKRAASILESNLNYFLKLAQQNEFFMSLLSTGYVWSNKKESVISSGDINALKKLHEELNERKSKTIEELKNNRELIKNIYKLKELSKEEVIEYLAIIEKYRESILRGEFTCSLDQLQYLDPPYLSDVVDIRNELDVFFVSIKMMIIHIHHRESIDENYLINQFVSTIVSLVNASTKIIPLIKYTRQIRNRSVLRNISWF